MILLPPPIREQVLEHAQMAYPNEGCGFLFGEEINGTRYIRDFLPVENAQEGDQRRLFKISTSDYLAAELHALDTEQDLLGIYHSHPEAPAIPSELDRRAAQPFFSYLIVSVGKEIRTEFRSWRLAENGAFNEETLTRSAEIADYFQHS